MLIKQYEQYLLAKQIKAIPTGFDVDLDDMHSIHFDWQHLGIQWCLKIGKAAMFWERGLGKTLAQLEFANQVHKKTKDRVLIVCPLAVARQTIREGQKIDVEIEQVRTIEDVLLADTPITIINYDMFRKFNLKDADRFAGIVLDESSILKSYTGATKKFILNFTRPIKYRLFCTATPSPNDYMELGNHAEGLSVMDSSQMLANWFINATGSVKTGEIAAGKYTIKPYGETDFWRWITTWAMMVSKPSDLGFSDHGYIRPPLDVKHHKVEVDHTRAWNNVDKKGQRYLMLGGALSATEMWADKSATYQDRCKVAIELVESEPDEYHIVWCDTNDEATLMRDELQSLYGDEVVEVRGSDKLQDKESKLDSFSNGNSRIIVTKSKIAGMGLNWQHCARQHFVSTNYKWEEWYQAVGRTDRFGNDRQTIVNMVYAETEQKILQALDRKGKQHAKMQNRVNEVIKEFGLWLDERKELTYKMGDMEMEIPQWLHKH